MDFMQELYWQKAKMHFDRLRKCEGGLMDAVQIVLALVMIVVVGVIGIYIAQATITATGTPTQANLSSMQTNLLASGQTGSSFIVILIISFIGGIAISYMFGMLRNRR